MSPKTPKKQGRTQGKTAKKGTERRPIIVPHVWMSRHCYLSLYIPNKGTEAFIERMVKADQQYRNFNLTHWQYWATSLKKLAKRKGESSTTSFYFHEVLFITILTNLLRFLTQTAIYANLKRLIYFEFNKEKFV